MPELFQYFLSVHLSKSSIYLSIYLGKHQLPGLCRAEQHAAPSGGWLQQPRGGRVPPRAGGRRQRTGSTIYISIFNTFFTVKVTIF